MCFIAMFVYLAKIYRLYSLLCLINGKFARYCLFVTLFSKNSNE